MLLHSTAENAFPADDHDVCVKQTLLENWQLSPKQAVFDWLSFKQFLWPDSRHNSTPVHSIFTHGCQ